MVDKASTKEEDSDGAHGESPNEKKTSQGNKACKKKGPRGSNVEKKTKAVLKLLRGVSFCIIRFGPNMYLKAMKRLSHYVCATYKNGLDVPRI